MSKEAEKEVVLALHQLKPARGSVHAVKRIGRGQGSGRGGTSTRGHKGAQSRSGYSRKFGFEGGQQPLQRRVPKYGFKNPNRVHIKGLNLDVLHVLVEKKGLKRLGIADVRENSLVRRHERLKILGRGDTFAKIEVEAHAFSKRARETIEKAGGKVIVLEGKA